MHTTLANTILRGHILIKTAPPALYLFLAGGNIILPHLLESLLIAKICHLKLILNHNKDSYHTSTKYDFINRKSPILNMNIALPHSRHSMEGIPRSGKTHTREPPFYPPAMTTHFLFHIQSYALFSLLHLAPSAASIIADSTHMHAHVKSIAVLTKVSVGHDC